MSCCPVNLFEFAWEKFHEHFSTSAIFSAEWEWINKTERCFVLITHLFSILATTLQINLMNNKYKAQTLTKNPIRNWLCLALASHAWNMSCSFSQSPRSIESRCMVMSSNFTIHYLWTCNILFSWILAKTINIPWSLCLLYQHCMVVHHKWMTIWCWATANQPMIRALSGNSDL